MIPNARENMRSGTKVAITETFYMSARTAFRVILLDDFKRAEHTHRSRKKIAKDLKASWVHFKW